MKANNATTAPWSDQLRELDARIVDDGILRLIASRYQSILTNSETVANLITAMLRNQTESGSAAVRASANAFLATFAKLSADDLARDVGLVRTLLGELTRSPAVGGGNDRGAS
ncbi:MAG TPA: hypothetical protein VGL86_19290 [Polyangia bacterium]|jgi:hypothetical protein